MLNVAGLNKKAAKNRKIAKNGKDFVVLGKHGGGMKYTLFADESTVVHDVHARLLLAQNPTLVKEVGKKEKKEEVKFTEPKK